jgi:hypothetical protein
VLAVRSSSHFRSFRFDPLAAEFAALSICCPTSYWPSDATVGRISSKYCSALLWKHGETRYYLCPGSNRVFPECESAKLVKDMARNY